MSTNEIENLNQSQPSRKTAVVTENPKLQQPKKKSHRNYSISHQFRKRRQRVSVVVSRNKEEQNYLQSAAAAKDGRCRKHPDASLLHDIRLPVACPPPP